MSRFSEDKWRETRHEACKGCGVAESLEAVNKHCGSQGIKAEPEVDEARIKKATDAIAKMHKALDKAEKNLKAIKKPSEKEKPKIKDTQELIDSWRELLAKDEKTIEGFEEEFKCIPKWVKKRTDFVAKLEKFAKAYAGLVEEQFKTVKRLPTYLAILADSKVDEQTKKDRFGVLEVEVEDVVKRYASEKESWEKFVKKDYDAERSEGGSLSESGINSEAAKKAAKKEGTGLWSQAEKARTMIDAQFVEFAKAVKEAQQQLTIGQSYMLKGEARVKMQVEAATKSLKTMTDALDGIQKVYDTGAKFPTILAEDAQFTIDSWKQKPGVIDAQIGKHAEYWKKVQGIVNLIESEYKRITDLVPQKERVGSESLEDLMKQIDTQYEKRTEKSQFYERGYREYIRRLEEAKRQATK